MNCIHIGTGSRSSHGISNAALDQVYNGTYQHRVSIQDFHKGQERECLPDSRFKHNVLQQKILLFYRIDILDFTKVVLK